MRLLSVLLSLTVVTCGFAADKVGDTRIAKWKDDKQAAFMLMFDDSCATHVKNAIPATHAAGPGSGFDVGLRVVREVR